MDAMTDDEQREAVVAFLRGSLLACAAVGVECSGRPDIVGAAAESVRAISGLLGVVARDPDTVMASITRGRMADAVEIGKHAESEVRRILGPLGLPS